jgi:hypothetical protein
MSKSVSDILFSVLGATAAGVTVFFIDRHLAKKQGSTAPVPTPDTLGVDNSFSAQFQAQVAALNPSQGNIAPAISSPLQQGSVSSSDCGCGGGGSVSNPITNSAPSLSQESILNSMNELSSLVANAGNVHYNRPVTNLG